MQQAVTRCFSELVQTIAQKSVFTKFKLESIKYCNTIILNAQLRITTARISTTVIIGAHDGLH